MGLYAMTSYLVMPSMMECGAGDEPRTRDLRLADIKTVQELMGHENISITKQYYIEILSSTKLVYDKTHPRA